MVADKREDHLRKGAEVSPLESMVAGGVSGAISRAVIAPLDTVKIRLQLETSQLHKYSGVTATFKQILRAEGVTGLWKGNVPAEIMYILYGAIQFTSYSAINRVLTDLQQEYTFFSMNRSTHSLIVGAHAGMASTLLTYPFDLLRTRLAANKKRELLSMVSTMKQIKQHDGWLGFFIGAKPALLSVASNTGLMFWTYEVAREYASKYQKIPFVEGFCGFLAGATAKGITFPLDTLRKRIQVKSNNGSTAFTLTKHILSNEGMFGFYKGFGVSLLKTAPASAVSIFMYEYSLSFMRSGLMNNRA